MLSSLFAADVEFDERYELIDIVQGLMAGDTTLLGKSLSVLYINNDRNAEEKFEMCSTESLYVSLVLCVVKVVKYENMLNTCIIIVVRRASAAYSQYIYGIMGAS